MAAPGPSVGFGSASFGSESSRGIRLPPTDYDQTLKLYIMNRSRIFRTLDHYREKGWSNAKGDRYFERQRRHSDESDDERQLHFYSMMKMIGKELQDHLSAFSIPRTNSSSSTTRPRILDFCSAPGGFLWQALETNPDAEAIGYTLPEIYGGHKIRINLESFPHAKILPLDITLLALDMGVTSIPEKHPDRPFFFPERRFSKDDDELFDLIICDGQVLRTHERAPYRDEKERYRLLFTQLALGLEHIREGGKMIILLRNLDKQDTATLVYKFEQFSRIRLRKPTCAHVSRGSFYLVASEIRPQHPDARLAVKAWKDVWFAATFGSEEKYEEIKKWYEVPVGELLELFGGRLVELGEPMWETQANALKSASWMREGEGREM